MYTSTIKLFITFSLLILAFQTQAQFNFGVGYSLGYLNPENDQAITNAFNEDRPWLEDEIEPINSIQGIHLSLRYRLDFVALDFAFRNKFRTKKSNGIDPSTSATFQRNLTHRFISYSLGIESFVGKFSYGGSIELENFAIRTEVTGIDGDFSIFKKYGLGSHLFVSFNLDAGDTLDFSIRPYVHVPWQRYNITSVNQELNEGLASNRIEDNYLNFGIMFIFYNGSK